MGIHFHDFHCQKLAQLGGNSAFACAHEADEQDIFIKQRFRLNPLAVFDDALEDMQDFLLKYGTCYLSGNPFQLLFLLLRLQNGQTVFSFVCNDAFDTFHSGFQCSGDALIAIRNNASQAGKLFFHLVPLFCCKVFL